ncbi:DNA polymerase delta small subunit Cdc1 [Rhizina undulata]
MAEYMTTSSLKNIPSVEIAAERDVSFRPDKASKKPKVEIDLLSPAKSISILESFLPSNLQFYRSTISPTEDVIHGSITANDVAHAIRAIASASGDEGSRVVIQTENITFKDDVEGGKLRQLGEYVFEVRMKGTAEFVRRKVLLMRQEEAE